MQFSKSSRMNPNKLAAIFKCIFISIKLQCGSISLFLKVRCTITQPLFNTLRPRQNGRHFPDDIFKCIFLNESVWISINISLMFVLGGPINDIPALLQVMAWCRPGDKPLSEPMMVRLPTHICVTRPQWVKAYLNQWRPSTYMHHRASTS